jgi:hypothetical protein
MRLDLLALPIANVVIAQLFVFPTSGAFAFQGKSFLVGV